MKEIEDVSEDSLPELCDGRIKDAKKYQQLGVSAMQNLFHAALEGARLDDVKALCCLSLQVREGDSLLGFLNEKAMFNQTVGLYYVGLCTNEKERKYAHTTVIDHYAKEMLAGTAPLYMQTDSSKVIESLML